MHAKLLQLNTIKICDINVEKTSLQLKRHLFAANFRVWSFFNHFLFKKKERGKKVSIKQ